MTVEHLKQGAPEGGGLDVVGSGRHIGCGFTDQLVLREHRFDEEATFVKLGGCPVGRYLLLFSMRDEDIPGPVFEIPPGHGGVYA